MIRVRRWCARLPALSWAGRCYLAACVTTLAAACTTAPTLPSYGNYGGAPRAGEPVQHIIPYKPEVPIRWFPIQAKFAPDGSWLVVNLCSSYNDHYCRLVRWEPSGPGQALHDGKLSSGRWRLIAGQDPDKSYLWPSISWDGKKLTFTVADCSAERHKNWPPPGATPGGPQAPPLHCAIFDARPAVSMDVHDIRVGYRELPLPKASRPSWRPDDQAIIYWRTRSLTTLASGRTIPAGFGVYEYDFAQGREEAKLDNMVSGISWMNEFATPLYSADGKGFTTCAYTVRSHRTWADSGFHCFKADPRQRGPIAALNGGRSFDQLHAHWRGSHYLVTNEGKLALARQTDPSSREVFVERGAPVDGVVAADISGLTGDLVAVRRTVLSGTTPARRGFGGHYMKFSSTEPDEPLLVYRPPSTSQFATVFWPNVESIGP